MNAAARDESLGSILAALAANTAIAVAKGTAAALTGSPALFAETLHTVADAGNEVLLYVAIRRSRHPPDASHPFGYGPERYYWALLAAIGMFVVGGAVSRRGRRIGRMHERADAIPCSFQKYLVRSERRAHHPPL